MSEESTVAELQQKIVKLEKKLQEKDRFIKDLHLCYQEGKELLRDYKNTLKWKNYEIIEKDQRIHELEIKNLNLQNENWSLHFLNVQRTY